MEFPLFDRRGRDEFVIRGWSDFVAEFSEGLPLALEIARDGVLVKGDGEFIEKFEELRKRLLEKFEFDRWRGVWMSGKNMRRA